MRIHAGVVQRYTQCTWAWPGVAGGVDAPRGLKYQAIWLSLSA